MDSELEDKFNSNIPADIYILILIKFIKTKHSNIIYQNMIKNKHSTFPRIPADLKYELVNAYKIQQVLSSSHPSLN